MWFGPLSSQVERREGFSGCQPGTIMPLSLGELLSATFSTQRGLGGAAPGDRWHRAPEANLGGILNFKQVVLMGPRCLCLQCLPTACWRRRAQLRYLAHVGMEARLQGCRGPCSGLSSAPTSRSTSSPVPRELPRWGVQGGGSGSSRSGKGSRCPGHACHYLGSPHTASQAPLCPRCGWHHVLSSVCLHPSWAPHQGPGGGERECFKCPLMVFCQNKCSRFRVDLSLSPQVTSFWVSFSGSPLPLPRCLSPSVSPSPSTEDCEAARASRASAARGTWGEGSGRWRRAVCGPRALDGASWHFLTQLNG